MGYLYFLLGVVVLIIILIPIVVHQYWNEGRSKAKTSNAIVVSKSVRIINGDSFDYVTFDIEGEGRVTFLTKNPGLYVEGDRGELTYWAGRHRTNLFGFKRF